MVKIVAIGTSAGGLKPLEEYFEAVRGNTDTCYVVVQHLSPGFRSLMDELLGRKSNMPIRKIVDGDVIEPNTIFLNSPSHFVEIDGNVFRLRPYKDSDGVLRLPINHFFYSLAESRHRPVAGVILSGTGSDGAKGSVELRRIGMPVFVEKPEEAEFGAMPRAVLDLCPQAIAASASRLDAVIQRKLAEVAARPEPPAIETPFHQIVRLLERQHGLDFHFYKEKTILRRIARRSELRGLKTDKEYLDLLETDPEALAELYSDLLIGVTAFYRDPECFSLLRELVYPSLIERAKVQQDVRIWVPACGTGEEAYSIAIDLTEAMVAAGCNPNFRIIATDVFNPAIRYASMGVYSESQLKHVPDDIKNRYFVRTGSAYSIHTSVRQRIIFSTHNAINDAPFMNLDFVSCRNMMIYLDQDGQDQLISRFIFGMSQDSFLLLGPSETLGRHVSEFAELSSKWRIFRKLTDRKLVGRAIFHTRPSSGASVETHSNYANNTLSDRGISARPLALEVENKMSGRTTHGRDVRSRLIEGYDALLKRYAPSSILVDLNGEVLTWFGSAGMYVDTKSNLAEWRVEEIIHPDLQYFINIGIEKVKNSELGVAARRIKVAMGDGKEHILDVLVEPLSVTVSSARCILILITRKDVQTSAEVAPVLTTEALDGEEKGLLSSRIRELEKDLRLTEESLQYVTERLEANAEELQASNEELQASNEELQASNEELQASNEELQAVNEELLSVSAEHERKIELTTIADIDQETVLDMLSVSTIFLDEDFQVSRFSASAEKLLGLKSHDEGRPIRTVGERLSFAELDKMAESARDTGREQRASGLFRKAPLTVIVRYVVPDSNQASGHYVVVLKRENNSTF